MRRMGLLALVVIVAGACGKGSTADTPSAAPSKSDVTREPSAAAPAPAAPAAPAASPAEPAAGAPNVAALLTDDKVRRYLVYQREIAGGAKGIGAMIGAAAPKVQKGEKPDVRLDDRNAGGLANAGQRGLAQSGLPLEEITQLTTVLTPYYTQRMMAVDAAKSLAKAKGPIMTGIFQKQVDKGSQLRADFEKQHGKAALATVDKHEKEAIQIQELLLKNALGPRR
jgi:hypothetical protein